VSNTACSAHGQLHHTQASTDVATGPRTHVDQALAHFLRKHAEIVA
jgi:hypothetical protein